MLKLLSLIFLSLWANPWQLRGDDALIQQRKELQDRATAALNKGQHAEAIPLLQQCLILQAKITPNPHPDLAVLQLQLGNVHNRLGQHREAQQTHEQSLSTARACLEKKIPVPLAVFTGNWLALATLHRQQGEYQKVALYLERYRAQKLKNQQLTLGTRLMVDGTLSDAYREMRQPDRALKLLNPLLPSASKALRPNSTVLARLHLRLATNYLDLSDHRKTEEHLESGLSILKAQSKVSTLHLVGLNLQCDFLAAQGHPEKIAQLQSFCLALAEKLHGKEHQAYADQLVRHGRHLVAQGKLTEGRQRFQSALIIIERVLGEAHPRRAQTLTDLAQLEHTLGHAHHAWTRYQQALDIFTQTLGAKSATVCAPLQHMAHIRIEQGQLPAAQALLQRALQISTEQLGPEHPETALLLASLGQLKLSMLDLAEARKLLDQSLVLHIRNHGATHPSTLSVRGERALLDEIFQQPKPARDAYEFIRRAHEEQNTKATPIAIRNLIRLARTENQTGQTKTASEYYRQALIASEKTLGPDHRENAVIRLNHAHLHYRNGDLPAAEALQMQAIQHLKTLSLTDSPLYLSALNQLALCQQKQNHSESALNTLDELLTRQHHHYQHVLGKLSETEALTYLQGQHRAVGRFQSICAMLRDDPAAVRLGAHQLALTKARLEEIRWAQSRIRNGDQPAFEQQRQLLAHIRAAIDALERRADAMEPGDVIKQRTRLTAQKREAEQKLSGLALEIDQSVANQLATRQFKLQEIARALPPESALIDLVNYTQDAAKGQPAGQHYAAYLTFAGQINPPKVFRIDLGPAKPIHRAVTDLNRLMYQRLYTSKQMPDLLKTLSQQIGQPLRQALGPVRRVFICPDSQLARLPFELLQHEQGYWLDDLEISYLGSGREALRLSKPQPKTQTGPAVVLGNPQFADPDPATVRSATFSPLPYSAKEMTSIAEALGNDTRQLTGLTATEAALKQLRRPSVLHLSTHAFYLHTPIQLEGEQTLAELAPHHLPTGRLNPLLRCGLALAGANSTDRQPLGPANDGLFTGQEAADLDLHGTRLVILSACESAVGEIHAGEGALSLRRAFRVAGAESVLASHWPVSDRATSELMRRFIKHWKSGLQRYEKLNRSLGQMRI